MKLKLNFNEIFSMDKIISVIIFIILAFCTFSSIYTVKESEVGVLRTLGKVTEITQPGIHFKFPYPVQQIDVINVSKANTMEIGIKDLTSQKYDMSDREGVMLTGDNNILLLDFIVEWKVNDPKAYLFNISEPDEIFKNAAISALSAAIGNSTIDSILTDGKNEIENKAKEILEQNIGKYNIGIQVLAVKIQDAQPPFQVQKSFSAVTDAREQKDSLINKAEQYKKQKLSAAEGEAQKVAKDAEAYYEERLNKAKAEAANFNSLYAEYKLSKEVTKTRLLMETLEEVLPGCNIYITDESGDIIKTLPTKELGGKANE